MYMQSHPENKYFIKITNMDHYQRISIKTNIHPKTQVLLRLQFLTLFQNLTQSPFF